MTLDVEVVADLELIKVIVIGGRAALEWLTVLEELDTKEVRIDSTPIAVILAPKVNHSVHIATRVRLAVILNQR